MALHRIGLTAAAALMLACAGAPAAFAQRPTPTAADIAATEALVNQIEAALTALPPGADEQATSNAISNVLVMSTAAVDIKLAALDLVRHAALRPGSDLPRSTEVAVFAIAQTVLGGIRTAGGTIGGDIALSRAIEAATRTALGGGGSSYTPS